MIDGEQRMEFKALIPMLHTNDIDATRKWYESMLGFRCVSAESDQWCRLQRDGVEIMFMRNAHMGAPSATATQYIYVDDVMDLWTSIKDRCSAEWGPEEMRYGSIEFAIRDPNGYLLSFGQPRRLLPPNGRAPSGRVLGRTAEVILWAGFGRAFGELNPPIQSQRCWSIE
jgi:catechol 2,3-dioxygenase-like lactoylglutathione lyase family enzyme